jgi:hypothetical protein
MDFVPLLLVERVINCGGPTSSDLYMQHQRTIRHFGHILFHNASVTQGLVEGDRHIYSGETTKLDVVCCKSLHTVRWTQI